MNLSDGVTYYKKLCFGQGEPGILVYQNLVFMHIKVICSNTQKLSISMGYF